MGGDERMGRAARVFIFYCELRTIVVCIGPAARASGVRDDKI